MLSSRLGRAVAAASTVALLATTALAQNPTIPSQVVRSFPSPNGYNSGLAWDSDTLWVSDAFANTISVHDPYTGAQIRTIPAPNAKIRDLTHDGIDIWLGSWFSPPTPSIFRISPLDGTVLSSIVAPFTGGKANGMAWDGALLWVGEEGGSVYQYDTNTRQLVNTVTVPRTTTYNPRGLAWDGRGGNLWAGYQSIGLIRRHNPADGSITGEFASPYATFQQGLTWDGWFLWATGGSSNPTVSQIDVTPPFVKISGPLRGGNRIQFTATMANPNELFLVAWSGSGTNGIPVGGTTVPLTFDDFTILGLQLVTQFQAVTDATGTATTPGFMWPNLPKGIPFWFCGITLDANGITAVSEPFKYLTD